MNLTRLKLVIAKVKALKLCFRPHQGIIEFNKFSYNFILVVRLLKRFRPHQGIIEFNNSEVIDIEPNEPTFGFRPHQGIIEFNMN